MEYISRKDALKAVDWDSKAFQAILNLPVTRYDMDFIRNKNIGKWVRIGFKDEGYTVEYRCTRCRYIALNDWKFCPNCGAMMCETEYPTLTKRMVK